MSNFFTDAITVVARWVGGREDLAANIVATEITRVMWWIPTLIATVVIYLFNRRARLSLRIYYRVMRFKLTNRRKNQIYVDGFYYAIYDSTKSKTNGKGTRVAECIYLSTDIFSNRVTGYVFRRAKRKNGKIVDNDYYLSRKLSPLRIVGRFSQNLQIFFGYWLDPYTPDSVAGTVSLRWSNKNMGVPEDRSKTYLLGQWDGVDEDVPMLVDEKNKNYYGFAVTGGEWKFHRISIGISGFSTWRKQLDLAGDTPAEPTKFLDWSPK